MTPFEQLLEDLLVERMRPTPPPPAQRVPVESAPELDVRRLVREVTPRVDGCERARRDRVRRHAQLRERVLTDVEIEAI